MPDDEDIVRSTNLGKPIALDEKSLVGEAFRRIARRIEGEEVPFIDIKAKRGFFSKLKGLFK